MRRILDRQLAPKIVIERVVEIICKPEKNMDPGALNVGVHHRNPVAHRRQLTGEVRRGVALARAASEGMDGNNGGHVNLLGSGWAHLELRLSGPYRGKGSAAMGPSEKCEQITHIRRRRAPERSPKKVLGYPPTRAPQNKKAVYLLLLYPP